MCSSSFLCYFLAIRGKKYYNEVVTDKKASYPVPDADDCRQMYFRQHYLKLKIRKNKNGEFY